MLNQLIESKSNAKENKTRGGYLLTTFVLITGLCFSAVLGSLFAKDLGMGSEEFELSSLVAPIQMPENAPVQKQEKREQSSQAVNETITRQTNMMRIDETPLAPDKISVVPNTQKARPHGYFIITGGLENGLQNSSPNNSGRGTGGDGIGLQGTQTAPSETVENVIPPPPIKKPIEESKEKKKTTLVSGGVINGKATNLPKPIYPPAAKAVNAGGSVNVQVTIDETGKVISAKAVDGHPLLRAAAEKAAWNAKFNPTLLTGQPVKVSGIIVYKFSI